MDLRKILREGDDATMDSYEEECRKGFAERSREEELRRAGFGPDLSKKREQIMGQEELQKNLREAEGGNEQQLRAIAHIHKQYEHAQQRRVQQQVQRQTQQNTAQVVAQQQQRAQEQQWQEQKPIGQRTAMQSSRAPMFFQLRRQSVDDFFASETKQSDDGFGEADYSYPPPGVSSRPDLGLFEARSNHSSFMGSIHSPSPSSDPEPTSKSAHSRSQAEIRRFDDEAEWPSSRFTPEEEGHIRKDFLETGRSRQGEDVKVPAQLEEKLNTVIQVGKPSKSPSSSSQMYFECVRSDVEMSKPAMTAAKPVKLNMPAPSPLWLDDIDMDSHPTPLQHSFAFAAPTSETRDPFAFRQTPAEATNYASRVAPPPADSTSPSNLQPPQEFRSPSLDRLFSFSPSPSPSQLWNSIPGLTTDADPGLSSSSWLPPVEQRVANQGLPTLAESYKKIFEPSKDGLKKDTAFSCPYAGCEQCARIAPESQESLVPGSEDDQSSSEEAEQTSDHLVSEEETESETGNYTSGSNSDDEDCESVDSTSDTSEDESDDQDSDSEDSEDDDEAPGGGAFTGGNPDNSESDSDNDDVKSNASTATLQHEIHEISEVPRFSYDDYFESNIPREHGEIEEGESRDVSSHKISDHELLDETETEPDDGRTVSITSQESQATRDANILSASPSSQSDEEEDIGSVTSSAIPSERADDQDDWRSDVADASAPDVPTGSSAPVATLNFRQFGVSRAQQDLPETPVQPTWATPAQCAHFRALYFHERQEEDAHLRHLLSHERQEGYARQQGVSRNPRPGTTTTSDQQKSGMSIITHNNSNQQEQEQQRSARIQEQQSTTESARQIQPPIPNLHDALRTFARRMLEDIRRKSGQSTDLQIHPTTQAEMAMMKPSMLNFRVRFCERYGHNATAQVEVAASIYAQLTPQQRLEQPTMQQQQIHPLNPQQQPVLQWTERMHMHQQGLNRLRTAQEQDRHLNARGAISVDRDRADFATIMSWKWKAPRAPGGDALQTSRHHEQDENASNGQVEPSQDISPSPRQRVQYYMARDQEERKNRLRENASNGQPNSSQDISPSEINPSPLVSQDIHADEKESSVTTSSSPGALQDYKFQLKLLEQQNKMKLVIALEEQERSPRIPYSAYGRHASPAQDMLASSWASQSSRSSATPDFAALDAALHGFKSKVNKATDAMNETVEWIMENSKYEEGKSESESRNLVAPLSAIPLIRCSPFLGPWDDDPDSVAVPEAPLDGNNIAKRMQLEHRTDNKEKAIWPAAEALKTSFDHQLDSLPKINKSQATYAEERHRHFQHVLQGIDTYRKAVDPSLLSKEQINQQLLEARKVRMKARRVVQDRDVQRHAPEFWKEAIASLKDAVDFWQGQQTLSKYSGVQGIDMVAGETPRDSEDGDNGNELLLTAPKRKAEDFADNRLANKRATFIEDGEERWHWDGTTEVRPDDKQSRLDGSPATKRKANDSVEERPAKRTSPGSFRSDSASQLELDNKVSLPAAATPKSRKIPIETLREKLRQLRAAALPESPLANSDSGSSDPHESTDEETKTSDDRASPIIRSDVVGESKEGTFTPPGSPVTQSNLTRPSVKLSKGKTHIVSQSATVTSASAPAMGPHEEERTNAFAQRFGTVRVFTRAREGKKRRFSRSVTGSHAGYVSPTSPVGKSDKEQSRDGRPAVKSVVTDEQPQSRPEEVKLSFEPGNVAHIDERGEKDNPEAPWIIFERNQLIKQNRERAVALRKEMEPVNLPPLVPKDVCRNDKVETAGLGPNQDDSVDGRSHEEISRLAWSEERKAERRARLRRLMGREF